MYSYEIDNLLKKKQYLLSVKEYLEAFNPSISTQISRLKYNPYNDTYECETNEGYKWTFKLEKRKEND